MSGEAPDRSGGSREGSAAREMVRTAYDLVSTTYRKESFDFESSGYRKYLSWIMPLLAPRARVLDLGCGCGPRRTGSA